MTQNLNHYFDLEENEENPYTFLPILPKNQKYYDSYKRQLPLLDS